MNNENLQNRFDENDIHTKKGTSNNPDNGSETTDDEYLKHAMAAHIPKEIESIKSPSRISGSMRSRSSGLTEKEYFETFFKIPKQKASKGRSVYIRLEFHQKFLKLIAGLEIDRLTMYAYLDNIIEHHFMEFEQLIHKIYQERNKPIF